MCYKYFFPLLLLLLLLPTKAVSLVLHLRGREGGPAGAPGRQGDRRLLPRQAPGGQDLRRRPKLRDLLGRHDHLEGRIGNKNACLVYYVLQVDQWFPTCDTPTTSGICQAFFGKVPEAFDGSRKHLTEVEKR